MISSPSAAANSGPFSSTLLQGIRAPRRDSTPWRPARSQLRSSSRFYRRTPLNVDSLSSQLSKRTSIRDDSEKSHSVIRQSRKTTRSSFAIRSPTRSRRAVRERHVGEHCLRELGAGESAAAELDPPRGEPARASIRPVEILRHRIDHVLELGDRARVVGEVRRVGRVRGLPGHGRARKSRFSVARWGAHSRRSAPAKRR